MDLCDDLECDEFEIMAPEFATAPVPLLPAVRDAEQAERCDDKNAACEQQQFAANATQTPTAMAAKKPKVALKKVAEELLLNIVRLFGLVVQLAFLLLKDLLKSSKGLVMTESDHRRKSEVLNICSDLNILTLEQRKSAVFTSTSLHIVVSKSNACMLRDIDQRLVNYLKGKQIPLPKAASMLTAKHQEFCLNMHQACDALDLLCVQPMLSEADVQNKMVQLANWIKLVEQEDPVLFQHIKNKYIAITSQHHMA